MTARAQLFDLLALSFPQPSTTTVLLPHPTQVDPPAVDTVMLRLDGVEPGAARGIRTYTFAAVLLASSAEVEGSDDALEALVELVLAALDNTVGGLAITWAGAKRGTYRGTIPAFEIPVTVHLAVTLT